MKAGLRRAIALSLGLCALTIPASAAATFTDVPSTYWGYSYITKAANNGLVSGIGNNQYGPEQKLSNAQFVTMVCNLFYSNQVKAQGTSSDWWRPYMNVAYANNLLSGTTVGQSYAATGSWSSSSVNGQISRYDMAQIMYNLSNAQKWESPDSMSLVLTQLLIKDFGSIPTNYQMPVAYCYAKGLLTGDENSNFNGSATTTRAQAAVVLCGLNDEKTSITAPTYTNSNRLANGLVATEENVANLIDDVWASYPDYDQWNVNTTYTSQRLGVGTGSKGFAYMISDKIFGGMPANQIDDPADLRLGDVISFNSGSQYGVVCEADEDSFTYVSCDSSGWISWKNDMYRDDLDRYDTVYTRYLNMPEPDDVLSNGKDATKANVEDILDDLQDDRDYKDGKSWDLDDEYESDVFGTYSGTRGFAYQISDEIFGDLDYETVDRENDLRVGDVVYDQDGYGLYGVVVSIDYSRERYTYVSVDNNDEINWDLTGYFDDLNLSRTYTRYPEDSDYDYSDRNNRLTNGDSVNENNVEDLLDSVLDRRPSAYYDDDDYWYMDEEYDSNVFGNDAVGSEAFAYYISDQVFGDLPDEDVTRYRDLRVGDVIYDETADRYGIVWSIDTSDDGTCTYYSVSSSRSSYGEVCRYTCDFADIDDHEMYTRYPD